MCTESLKLTEKYDRKFWLKGVLCINEKVLILHGNNIYADKKLKQVLRSIRTWFLIRPHRQNEIEYSNTELPNTEFHSYIKITFLLMDFDSKTLLKSVSFEISVNYW